MHVNDVCRRVASLSFPFSPLLPRSRPILCHSTRARSISLTLSLTLRRASFFCRILFSFSYSFPLFLFSPFLSFCSLDIHVNVEPRASDPSHGWPGQATASCKRLNGSESGFSKERTSTQVDLSGTSQLVEKKSAYADACARDGGGGRVS